MVPGESRLTAIPDHLLAEIFLRLPTAEDLARTTAACVSFRSLVTAVRRFRRLHAPPFIGFLNIFGFHPTLPPHHSAPAAKALDLAADFSFSFLPSHCRWTPVDTRDGRVLLHRVLEEEDDEQQPPPSFLELAVCDPVHRRYVLLPPASDDLADASVEQPALTLSRPWCDAFFVPLAKEEAEAADATAFTVICMAYYKTKLASFVFSSSTGQWHPAATSSWSDLFLGRGAESAAMVSLIDPENLRRHYAYGCFYWDSTCHQRKELIVLDTWRMEFSIADLPPSGWGCLGIAIVEAGEGRPGMFGSIDESAADGTSVLCYAIWGNKGETSSSKQWRMEKTFSFGPGAIQYPLAATERYLLLVRVEETLQSLAWLRDLKLAADVEYFSMDVKSMQLEWVSVKPFESSVTRTHIYTNFPPSLLSSPTV